MTKDIAIEVKSLNITCQRNFFAGCLAITLLISLLLSFRLAITNEKIIMVPGIAKEMIIEGDNISKSYLEETSLLFISALLDLTPTTIDAKRDIILKYTSQRSHSSLRSLQKYFALASETHKKFQLSTFFAPKKLHLDSKNLQVIIEGIISSTFGKRGFEEREAKYKLSFDYVGGHLQLKEFVELKKDDNSVNQEQKNEGE